MKRRDFLVSGAAAGAASMGLAAPRIAHAAKARVLKFIPQADLAVLDPVWTTAYVTRNHGFMVFDTLYGQNGKFQATPQMVAGHTVGNGGKLWKLTLRDGLKFHDGEKVLARDCVASIKRWGARDGFGQALMAATDELSAADDKTIVFKLKAPFPLLPDALGKTPSNMCPMMPERLAKTDPFKQVTEMVGSGPFTFNAKERIPGSRIVYEKFAGYVPLSSGTPDWTSGPKVVHFDRVEWHVIPDPATSMNALMSGEVDWWENPTFDLLQVLKTNPKLHGGVQDPTGLVGIFAMNHLYPPFDNQKIRQALLGAVNQAEYMTAVSGTNKNDWHVPVGVFPPPSPMATTVGLDVFTGPRDYAKVKAEIMAAGYKGEKIVLMAATDFPIIKALNDVAADMLKKCGFNVDYQAMDWGTVVQRRAKMDPPDKGGWNVFNTFFAGLDQFNPAGDLVIRGNGKNGWFGWPTDPKLEALRTAWFAAPDLAAQQKVCVEIQKQALIDVPYIPLGQTFTPTAYKKQLQGVLNGFVLFWNVKRA
ncbi:MAG TPA: ABC transporter substrate-binding protein [Acetobacteraceae bacterium]|nr:ABC transporter substrate-binding protein [Acetobacteraceae bacterium]